VDLKREKEKTKGRHYATDDDDACTTRVEKKGPVFTGATTPWE